MTLSVCKVEQVCAGLRYLHYHEPPVIHGDLKPVRSCPLPRLLISCTAYQENVLVDSHGRALINDFGSAEFLHTPGPPERERFTLHYSPRERVHGVGFELLPSTDIWALGMTIYTVSINNSSPNVRFLKLSEDRHRPHAVPLLSHSARGSPRNPSSSSTGHQRCHIQRKISRPAPALLVG